MVDKRLAGPALALALAAAAAGATNPADAAQTTTVDAAGTGEATVSDVNGTATVKDVNGTGTGINGDLQVEGGDQDVKAGGGNSGGNRISSVSKPVTIVLPSAAVQPAATQGIVGRDTALSLGWGAVDLRGPDKVIDGAVDEYARLRQLNLELDFGFAAKLSLLNSSIPQEREMALRTAAYNDANLRKAIQNTTSPDTLPAEDRDGLRFNYLYHSSGVQVERVTVVVPGAGRNRKPSGSHPPKDTKTDVDCATVIKAARACERN